MDKKTNPTTALAVMGFVRLSNPPNLTCLSFR